MKINTKFFIALAILIATLSAFILVSSAEESTATITVTDVESLNSAISDSNVTYIKIGADFTVDEPIIVSRDGITIDLNGHTITAYKNEISTNQMLFKLKLENMNFEIKGSGKFNVCRTLFDTADAQNAKISVYATGNGITVTSPVAYSNAYFKIGTSTYKTASMNFSGKLHVLHSAPSSTFEVYKSSTLDISNAEIIDDIQPDLFNIESNNSPYIFRLVHAAKLNIDNSKITANNSCIFNLTKATMGNASTVTANMSSLFTISTGYIVDLNEASYSNMTFNKCLLSYSNYGFCERYNTTLTKYYLNITLKDTQTLFSGTVATQSALLSGKGITAVIEGGFHNLNGASLAIGTVPYASNNGVLIKKGTAISCKFDSYDNVMFEKGAETAKWYDKTDGNLIAMGYYDSAQEAVLDTSVLPIVVVNDQHYNLKYTSWKSTYKDNVYNFTPDESTMLPIPAIRGIKYNLSIYTNFNMNIYVPSDIDMIGGYWDANCTYPLNSTSHKIGEEEYLKYSFEFYASDMDRIVMYVKYNAEYKETVYTLIQKIEVSVIDYTESILKGSEFSDIEKQLAADMLRYCNETIKIADGSYNFTASRILETYKEHLTDINSIQLENTDTDCKNLSYYIEEAMPVFNSYEPKFAFRYTENVTSPSASESDSGIWLNITYNSVDGTQKTAKTELNTDNSLFFAFGISAYDIDEVLTIRVCAAGEDKPLAEGTFSLSTYILTLESTSIDMTFAKVLYAYSLSAEIYKKSI